MNEKFEQIQEILTGHFGFEGAKVLIDDLKLAFQSPVYESIEARVHSIGAVNEFVPDKLQNL